MLPATLAAQAPATISSPPAPDGVMLAFETGVYEIAPGFELHVTLADGGLAIRSTTGGGALRLWPESTSDFFVNEADAQVTFTRDASGAVTGLVLHQYGRDRPGRKIR